MIDDRSLHVAEGSVSFCGSIVPRRIPPSTSEMTHLNTILEDCKDENPDVNTSSIDNASCKLIGLLLEEIISILSFSLLCSLCCDGWRDVHVVVCTLLQSPLPLLVSLFAVVLIVNALLYQRQLPTHLHSIGKCLLVWVRRAAQKLLWIP